ncbi:MAG: hypothetical protein ABIK37_01625 [candidate division WOR-3 bacterium]
MRIVTLLIIVTLGTGFAPATEWDPATRLTENAYSDFSYWSTQRRVVVDPAGRVHVAWHVMNSGLGTFRFQVYYKRWYPTAGWTSDTMLSADLYGRGVFCKYPSLAVDSSGRVWAVWAGGANEDADSVIYVKSCVPGTAGNGGWDESSGMLSAGTPSPAKGCPTLAATPDGRLHATWLEGTAVVHRERIDTLWSATRTVEGGTNYKAYPAVAGGPDNRLHLTWYGREGSSGYYDVFYKARTDTTWGATENVSNGERHQMYQSVAVNPATGLPHVLWQCYGAADNKRRTVHRWRSASGWQPTDTLSEHGDTLEQETGQLVFTLDGRGHALWSGRSPAWPNLTQVRYAERSAAGVWSGPFNVTDTSGSKERPSVAAGTAGAAGDVHVVWTDYRDGNAEVYYCRGAAGQFVEERGRQAWRDRVGASVVAGVLRATAGGRAELLDAAGRVVMELQPGANDVRRLSPGIYFVRRRTGAGVRRVLILR